MEIAEWILYPTNQPKEKKHIVFDAFSVVVFWAGNRLARKPSFCRVRFKGCYKRRSIKLQLHRKKKISTIFRVKLVVTSKCSIAAAIKWEPGWYQQQVKKKNEEKVWVKHSSNWWNPSILFSCSEVILALSSSSVHHTYRHKLCALTCAVDFSHRFTTVRGHNVLSIATKWVFVWKKSTCF